MFEIRNKVLINVIFLFLVVFSFLHISQNYLLIDIDLLSSEIVSKKQEFNNLNKRNSDIDDLRKDYAKIENEMGEASSVIIDEDIVNFIEKIEDNADVNDLKLEIESVVSKIDEEDTESDYIISKSFDVKTAGSFNNVMNFLYILENFDYYVNVEDIRMSQGSFDEYNKDLTILETKITVYQKKDE